jgi:hypothetical protein
VYSLTNSVGSIRGVDSLRLASLGDFCERVKKLDSKVEESIRFKIRAGFLARIWAICESHQKTRIFALWSVFFAVISSVGTNPGIEFGGFDSFSNFCGRARSLDSNVKESIPNRHDSQTKKILLVF